MNPKEESAAAGPEDFLKFLREEGREWLGRSFVDESFEEESVPAEKMDSLWAEGWRHFGARFFRYSIFLGDDVPQRVQPLRVVLNDFQPSFSQRRILRRNADLVVRFQSPQVDAERQELFARHARRFRRNVPASLGEFLGPNPGFVPCPMIEVAVSDDGQLVAVSYLDLGREGASSIYGMFEPDCARRSLGTATMLWEIGCAQAQGCRFYYPGYAFRAPSSMDYKKQFAGCEHYDWNGHWLPLPPPAAKPSTTG